MRNSRFCLIVFFLFTCVIVRSATLVNTDVTSNRTINDNVSVTKSIKIADGVTLTINKNLSLYGLSSITLQGNAKLIVQGDVICYENSPCTIQGDGGAGKVQVNGTVWSYSRQDNAVLTIKDLSFENDLKIGRNNSSTGGTVRLENVAISNDMIVYAGIAYTVAEIPSSSRVSVGGNLTTFLNSQTNIYGRLVVGSGSYIEGRYIIDPASGTGTVTNKGRINIETPLGKRNAAKTNSDLYAALTARDVISNGYIYESEGFLIAQNDMKFSKGVYFEDGHSYVYVWNDMYQEKGASIGSTGVGATETIMVGNTYNDATTFDWTSVERTLTGYTFYLPHLWYFERYSDGMGNFYGSDGEFVINPGIELIVDSYVLNGTNKSNLVHSKDVSFLNDQKTQAQEWINDAEAAIKEAEDAIKDWTAPDGKEYTTFMTRYASWPEDRLASYIEEEIAKQRAIINEKSQKKNLWEEQIEYSNILIGYIKNYDNKNGNEFKKYKKQFEEWCDKTHYSSNVAWGQIKKTSGIRNLLLMYIEQYGINAGDYEDVAKKISVMLPIELSYFNVTQEGSFVVFEWTTETETNNDFFTVEYSIDGVQYNALTNVEGAGTSTEKLLYSADAEADMFDGIVYFRLKQTDFNGESTYSDVKAIDIQGENADFVVYPNPATNEITIEGGEYANVYFVDMQSKTYSAEQIGENQYSVENLPNGLNFVVIETARGPIHKKIMIVRE